MLVMGKCRLPEKLLQADMTQQELAEQLGVKKQQIHEYVREKKPKKMGFEIAVNIAEIINCDPRELYEWIHVEVRPKRR